MNIRAGADSFLRHVEYVVGEGNRIHFWHEPWSGPIPLKDLYPDLFACSVSKKLIFLIWLFMYLKMEIGVGIYNSTELIFLLLNVLGCKKGTIPMKYLGLPLGAKIQG